MRQLCVYLIKNRQSMEQNEFEHIATNLRRRLMSTATGCGLNAEEAEDVAQDTMLKLWTIREKLQSGNKTEAFAVTVAKHLAIDKLRRRHTVGIDGRDKAASKNEMPDTMMECAENEHWLNEKAKQLPSAEYAVLHLRQVEQKSTEEIAAIVGIKTSSVPTLLARARKKLMEELKKRN